MCIVYYLDYVLFMIYKLLIVVIKCFNVVDFIIIVKLLLIIDSFAGVRRGDCYCTHRKIVSMARVKRLFLSSP